MTTDSEIIRKIGGLLWSIFPQEASHIEFVGRYYPSRYQGGPNWYSNDGQRLGPKAYTPDLLKLTKEISELIIDLQKTPPFQKTPFTHIKYVLNNDGKADLKFRYIPEWDSWTGLFMRGISDVAEDELITVGIPKKDWEAACKRRKVEQYD